MTFYQTHLSRDWATVRGPGRLLAASVDAVPIPTAIDEIIHTISFEAQGAWQDIGATKGGINIEYNYSDPQLSINRTTKQVDTDYLVSELSASTNLAENTFETYQFAWNTSDKVNGVFTVGTPDKTPQKRICVAYQDTATQLIRAYVFYRAVIVPQGNMNFQKTGDQVTIPVNIIAAPDLTQSDLKNRYMSVMEQVDPIGEEAEDLVLI